MHRKHEAIAGTRVEGGSFCTGNHPVNNACESIVQSMPVIDVTVGGKIVMGLVDTGCSKTIIREGVVDTISGGETVAGFDGAVTCCRGSVAVSLGIADVVVELPVVVTLKLISGVDVIMGMDVIRRLGGVFVDGGVVKFGTQKICLVVEVPGQSHGGNT